MKSSPLPLYLYRRAMLVAGAALLTLLVPLEVQGSGTSGSSIQAATRTIDRIVDFLTGGFAQSALILAIVIAGLAWWLNRSTKAAEVLGRICVGAIIIFGAPQIVTWLGLAGAAI